MKFIYKLKNGYEGWVTADNIMSACEHIKRKNKLDGLDFPYGIEMLKPMHSIQLTIYLSDLQEIYKCLEKHSSNRALVSFIGDIIISHQN